MNKERVRKLAKEVKDRVAKTDEDTMEVCIEVSMREGLSEGETRLLLDLTH